MRTRNTIVACLVGQISLLLLVLVLLLLPYTQPVQSHRESTDNAFAPSPALFPARRPGCFVFPI